MVVGREAEALRLLTAVDGSLLPALPRMAWALWRDADHHAAKMHVQFDVLRGVPRDATVTAGNGPERDQLRAMLQPGRLYVFDGGYAEYAFFREVREAGSSFIGRVREDATFVVAEERPIEAAARSAGVIRDVVVSRLGTDHHKDELRRPVRLVSVVIDKVREDGSAVVLVLCTDLLDLPADLVALGYKFRWSVELFFRWLKCILGCRHLLFESPRGVALQVYVALIASVLVSLWMGQKPTKQTFEMLCFYFSGMASLEELLAHIEKLQSKTKPRGPWQESSRTLLPTERRGGSAAGWKSGRRLGVVNSKSRVRPAQPGRGKLYAAATVAGPIKGPSATVGEDGSSRADVCGHLQRAALEGYLTRQVTRLACLAAGRESFAEAERLLDGLCGWSPSDETIRQACQAEGAKIASFRVSSPAIPEAFTRAAGDVERLSGKLLSK